MALQGIRRIAHGIVQDPTINSGRPIIEGTRVFVDRLIGHLENGMSSVEICHEYDLTSEQVMAVKQLSQAQVQYIKGYADALENVVMREEKHASSSTNVSAGRKYATQNTDLLAKRGVQCHAGV